MEQWLRQRVTPLYEQVLQREIADVPTHVAVIQDGNRRYARRSDENSSNPYRAGAQTTEQILEWCQTIGVEELTLYTFSTENFDRSDEENEALFELLCEKLRHFADADRVHENEVTIQILGDVDRLPGRVQTAIEYAEAQTREYDQFVLNIALAYGGRSKLLEAIQNLTRDVDEGALRPVNVTVETIEERLYDQPVRSVDLVIRTGGDERTSNFLPWHACGNEAAVFFCTPFWPEFSKIDFLRAIRTYDSREASWRRTRARRALILLDAVSDTELAEARAIVNRFRESLPPNERPDSADFEISNSEYEGTN